MLTLPSEILTSATSREEQRVAPANFECVPHVALSKFPLLVPWLSGASESHRMRWGSGSVVPVVLVVLRFSNVFEF